MKKLLALLPAIILVQTVCCQQNPVSDLKIEKEKYGRRSKTEKTVAWIMAGAGAAVIVATAIHDGNDNGNNGGINFNGLSHSLNTAAYISGGALLAGSGLLFILSAADKKKAAGIAVFLRPQQLTTVSAGGLALHTVPCAGIRIGL